MTELVDFREGAKDLRLSIYTLRSWVAQRRIPFVRLGRRILLRREDVEALISKNVVPSKSSENI